ncbi:DUF3306 domain-containing protein [Vibrio cionasavignyae]|uniref:DUF3306 domain-containing protein n=1 Tax=Vibrio cionasavignyae TaxID=2910252 RepID=UPI003D13E374
MKNSFLSRWSQRKLETDKTILSGDLDPASDTDDVQLPEGTSQSTRVSESRIEDLGSRESHLDADEPAVIGEDCEHEGTERSNSADESDNNGSEGDDIPIESLSMSELMTKTGLDKAAKKAALRKMFLSPEFNVVDRLNDYDHDYAAVKPLAAGVAETLREWVKKVEELDSDTARPKSVEDNHDSYAQAIDDEHADDAKQASGDDAHEAEQNNNAKGELQQTRSEDVTDVDTSSSVSSVNDEMKVEARKDDGVAKD